MKTADIVIGANYGDEGKGVTTDFLASKYPDSCLVVRFNGGAQAAHTVVTPQYRILPEQRYVFSHFGSGTALNKPTYLSEKFVVNPILFNKEYIELSEKTLKILRVYINPNCIVTTPFDMLINQIFEIVKDKNKHGSCGIGFNEAITRHLNQRFDYNYKITVKDLFDTNITLKRLLSIQVNYIHERLKELNIIKLIPSDYEGYLLSETIRETFIEDVIDFRRKIILTNNDILDKYNHVIFEGAQGLMLDEKHNNFPHVTRSRTGLKNVSKILSNDKFNKIIPDVYYVTRAYLTRHGVGPFEDENDSVCESYNIEDKTNITNQFQGSLRFGYLNLDLLANSIDKDLTENIHLYINKHIAITCLDQIPDMVKFKLHDKFYIEPKLIFIEHVLKKLEFRHALLSFSPTRDKFNDMYI